MDYLLVCRSITFAQKVNTSLMREGINSRIVRTPLGAASESCGYSVRINSKHLDRALRVLKGSGLLPKKLLRALPNGRYVQEAM